MYDGLAYYLRGLVMNIHKDRFAKAVAVGAVVVALITACTGNTSREVGASSSASSPASPKAAGVPSMASPSQAPSIAPIRFDVQQLKGTVPATLPTWEVGGSAEDYSVRSLLFLNAAAQKAGVKVPPITYAMLRKPVSSVRACLPGSDAPLLTDTYVARYCEWGDGKQSGILLRPGNWVQMDPWSETLRYPTGHPLHHLVDAVAVLVNQTHPITTEDIPTQVTHLYCIKSNIYRGIVLAQPELEAQVRSYLTPRDADPYPTEQWMYEYYTEGCSRQL